MFGLNIYSLSLSEATLTEEDLIMLFNSLPKRCILLLEDVDTAGLARSIHLKGARDRKSNKNTGARKRKNQGSSKTTRVTGPDKNTLTLSGLLNAIDGVASQEGRVLIMTTNHPEHLDPALTRPGRVDLSIAFSLATTQQIKDLFLSMYSIDTADTTRQPTKISQILETLSAEKNKKDDEKTITALSSNPGSGSGSAGLPNPLDDLANTFATTFPERVFSPADIQGYLLTNKTDPACAVTGVAKWRDEQLAKKAVPMTMHTDDATCPAFEMAGTNRAVVAAPEPVLSNNADASSASTNGSDCGSEEDGSASGDGGYDATSADSDSDDEL